jgi:hypothetical protein
VQRRRVAEPANRGQPEPSQNNTHRQSAGEQRARIELAALPPKAAGTPSLAAKPVGAKIAQIPTAEKAD